MGCADKLCLPAARSRRDAETPQAEIAVTSGILFSRRFSLINADLKTHS